MQNNSLFVLLAAVPTLAVPLFRLHSNKTDNMIKHYIENAVRKIFSISDTNNKNANTCIRGEFQFSKVH